MNMRDKIAEVIESEGHAPTEYIADAILGALPDMIAPLVWDDSGTITRRVVGRKPYNIFPINGSFALELGMLSIGRFARQSEAQAAANTHHRAAIMAAFTGETQ